MSTLGQLASQTETAAPRARVVSWRCMLVIAFAVLSVLGSAVLQRPGSVRADEHADLLNLSWALTASATPQGAQASENTSGAGLSEAPVPTAVPSSTATNPQPDNAPSQTSTETPRQEAGSPSQPSSTSAVATSTPGGPHPSESTTLRDFAEAVGWPPVVEREAYDRLRVRKSTSNEESMASIRVFGFRAGAEAAFSAEQEDARMSGGQVTQESFYALPAYSSYTTGEGGLVIARRYRWLVQTWIMGVEVRRSGVSQAEVAALARQLLAVAAHNGLSVPQEVKDSATGTPQATAARPSAGCPATFGDVPESMWAHGYITELACKSIVSGYRDGTFRPQNATTRGQLVKMVVLLEGVALEFPPNPSFTDVGLSHSFYPYIETAASHRLVSGYADGTFRADAPVSRAQVAKIVVRARKWELQLPANPVTLCDVAANHWAYVYIQVAIGHGIFTGYGDGCFRPDDFATRAQLAKVLVLAHR